MDKHKIFEVAPCLKDGPLSEAGLDLINEMNKIPKSESGDLFKILSCYYLTNTKEVAFEKEDDPTFEIIDSLNKIKRLSESFNLLNLEYFNLFKNDTLNELNSTSTASYYGDLFKDFDFEKYYNETPEILKTRLERNKVYPKDLNAKTVLDVGCGDGKYSLAWKQLGAKEVTGVDFSEKAINIAKDRVRESDSNINYKIDDALNLSIENNSFDIVYCFGVLHHTSDPKKGISELVRVLKEGGFGWLYLIERPGGFNWDIVEILRLIMKDIDVNYARKVLSLLNVPSKKIFRTLDHVLAPINIRLTEKEIEKILEEAGAKQIKKMKRGTNFDRIEKIYRGEPNSEIKYGVGQNSFVFSK